MCRVRDACLVACMNMYKVVIVLTKVWPSFDTNGHFVESLDVTRRADHLAHVRIFYFFFD